jgi:hypothetical protein
MMRDVVVLDSVSGELKETKVCVNPSTQLSNICNPIIIRADVHGLAMPQLLLKKPKTNFHAGTRNGMPLKRRK